MKAEIGQQQDWIGRVSQQDSQGHAERGGRTHDGQSPIATDAFVEQPGVPVPLIARHGALGLITFDHPPSRNALTTDIAAALRGAFDTWAGDADVYAAVIKSASPAVFCSGHDDRDACTNSGASDHRDVWAGQSLLYWRIDCFPKPIVALIDGPLQDAGVSLVSLGTHRVGTDRFKLEYTGGWQCAFPDAGGTWVLPRLPHFIGHYLALTGATLGPADAYALGILTHVIAANRWDAIPKGLSSADPVDPILDALHAHPGPGLLYGMHPVIEHCFCAKSCEEIVARLEGLGAEHEAWARQTLAALADRGAGYLKLTQELLMGGAHLGLRDVLTRDYAIKCRLAAASGDDIARLCLGGDGASATRPLADQLAGVPDDLITAMASAVLSDGDRELLTFPSRLSGPPPAP